MPAPVTWHDLPADAVMSALGTRASGLTEKEAAERHSEHGWNELPETPRRPWWRILLAQCQSPLIYLLLLAAGLALALGERRDAAVILAVVVINALIGAFQEGRAERSMEALRRLSAVRVRVRRDGRVQEIAARELVPGDMLELAAGDAVVADARLLEAVVLEAAEAALTGESAPVAKHAGTLVADTLLAERTNMIYSGTHLTTGRGRAVVVAIGLATEVGRIARMTATAVEPSTPLEGRIAQFGRQLVVVACALFVVVMGIGLWRGVPLTDLLMVAISQMVSLVPEGLPVAMTVALAVGMQRMARQRAIVRRLAAVETLGATSVICTDKTGTLTKNEMTVTTVWLPDDRSFKVTGVGYGPEGWFEEHDGVRVPEAEQDAGLRPLLHAAVLCNDAQLVPPDATDPRWRVLGDPTEGALLTLAMKGYTDPEDLRRHWTRRAEIPFDSGEKMMATQHGHPHGHQRVLLKGAPERVLELCTFLRRGESGLPMEGPQRKHALAVADQMARRGLRVLALAEVYDGHLDETVGFKQFRERAVLLGLVGQMDPPREEVVVAIDECRRAGIRPVMVTGDHKATGLAIAEQIGLARAGDRAVDGRELEAMPEQDLLAEIDRIAVFARVHPAQKLRIVEAFQTGRRVVAMTGDGVNDAPALARADVGVAMGITGTEVAKSAAKIVIADDNFATIVRAVEQGRLVHANIQKLLLFLFATSIDEVIVLLSALLLGCPLPLLAVQILWINLVTEGTLTVNLVMEGPEGDEMQRPPVRPGGSLITSSMLRRMALMVPASVVATLGFFLWRLSTGAPLELVRTETFTVLAVCQWFNVLNCESATRSVLQCGVWRNKWLLGGLALANLLQLAVVYLEPMNRLFHTVPIPVGDFFLIGAIASLVLWVEEIRKIFARRRADTNRP
ncbi:MAG: HAD-IC family P-type ATPase [Opitutae bacterium]|nr:HAD-IC family P-type ATPase [Opitutae bacterium]